MSIILNGTTGVTYPDSTLQAPGVSAPATVAQGGIGRTSTTAYAVICGGTTSTAAEQSIASVGTSGQILTSNGAGALPTFQSAAAGGGLQGAIYTTGTSTWTCPAGVTKVKVTVIGGGGGGSWWSFPTYWGGSGGCGMNYYSVSAGTGYTVTVGAGGNGSNGGAGSNGGTSSFTTFITATGGTGTPSYNVAGTNGTCANGLIYRGGVVLQSSTAARNITFQVSVGDLVGLAPVNNGTNGATTYSAATPSYIAGAGGASPSACNGSGGVGGIVIIEYVG